MFLAVVFYRHVITALKILVENKEFRYISNTLPYRIISPINYKRLINYPSDGLFRRNLFAGKMIGCEGGFTNLYN